MASFGESKSVSLHDQRVDNPTEQKVLTTTIHKTINSNTRVLKTTCVYVALFTLGMVTPLLGNTLVHLERLFDVTTTTMSLALPVQSCGNLVGSMLCGVLFDRVNHEMAFTVAYIVMGLGLLLSPFIGGLVYFMVAISIHATSQGFIISGSQSYIIELWAGHRYREPVLLASHAVWSLAGTVSPFIISQFLVDLPPQPQYQSASLAGNWSILNAIGNESFSLLEEHQATVNGSIFFDAFLVAGVEKVRFTYVTLGLPVFIAGLLFAVVVLRDRSRREKSALNFQSCVNTTREIKVPDVPTLTSEFEMSDSTLTDDRLKHHDRFAYIVFIALIFIFFFFLPFGDLVPVAFMTTFTVKYLNFPIQNASLLMSLFFGFHFAGRVVGIPLSIFLRPRTMLSASISLLAVSFILLLAFVNVWPTIIWISAPLAAVSISTTYATTLLWIGDRVPVTGAVASLTFFAFSLGLTLGQLIVSQLFEKSAMWFVYVLVIASISNAVVFFVLMVFDARCGARVRRSAGGSPLSGSISQ